MLRALALMLSILFSLFVYFVVGGAVISELETTHTELDAGSNIIDVGLYDWMPYWFFVVVPVVIVLAGVVYLAARSAREEAIARRGRGR